MWIDFKVDIASHPSLVFEFDLLMPCGFDRHEPEVDEWLKLHVWCRPECVQEELELLIVALCLDLDDVVEVSTRVRREGDVHLDGKTGCERAVHVVLDLELGGLRAGELQPPDPLADVPDGDCDLIVLVGLDVYISPKFQR